MTSQRLWPLVSEVRLGGGKRIRPNGHIVVKCRIIRRAGGTGNVKLLVIVVAEKWFNGLVLPAVSRGTFGRALSWRWCPVQKGVFS